VPEGVLSRRETRGFDAERINRAGDADRVLFVLTEAATVQVFATPLSDETIARCRVKARAQRMP
jgi:hypothetical protein